MSFEFTRSFLWKPIFPPAPARPAKAEDAPEKGVAVLRGLGGKLIDLSFSENSSWTKSKPVELSRQVTVERVYQKEDGGGGASSRALDDARINRENYVDIERVQRIRMRDNDGTEKEYQYAVPDYEAPDRYNIEVLEKDIWIENVAIKE